MVTSTRVTGAAVIITLGGTPGSGKGTTGKMLAQRLGVPYFSMGDVRREYALERGMTLAELNALGETDPKSDSLVDKFQASLPQRYPSFVMDSRLGYHFLPRSVKIYLDADMRVAAQRIFVLHRPSENWTSVEQGVAELRARESSDKRRYAKYYGIDPYDPKRYDLVIDTSRLTPQEVLDRIIAFLRSRGIAIPAPDGSAAAPLRKSL